MLAALILVPLMQFAYTSHRSAEIRTQRTLELYASDSGIEDALYQIKTEKKGTELGNLGFSNTTSYDVGTPGMNDRTIDASVQKVWIPEGEGISTEKFPLAARTEAPTGDTDKSSQLVVVGMLQTVQAAAASDDFDSGTWSEGTGWEDDWDHTGSASLASGGASGYSLNFAGAAGTTTRQTSLPKYVQSALKFDAKASSFGSNDTAICQVSTDGITWPTVETWSQGNETPDYNSFNIDLYNQYGLGGGNTTVPLWVRFDTDLHSSVIASQDFEPPDNTWIGGSGWTGAWSRSSSTYCTIATSGGFCNSYQMRLQRTGSAWRQVDLSTYGSPHLQFYFRTEGYDNSWDHDYAYLDISKDGGVHWTNNVWTWSGGTRAYPSCGALQDQDVDLTPYAGSSQVVIRFRGNAESGEYFDIDNISITGSASFSVDNLWLGYQANSNTIQIADTGQLGDHVYLDRIGVWMPAGCHYIGVVEDATTVELRQEPTTILPATYADGTILEWDFGEGDVDFHTPPVPLVKTLTFTYRVDVAQSVEGMFTWIKAHGPGPTEPTYISWDKGYEIYKAVSQAHSEILGTNTKVTAYAAQGEVNKRNAASYGDYVATGNPLLIDYSGSAYVKDWAIDPTDPSSWRTKDGFLYDGRSEITTIPSDAKVTAAWLYWSAFLKTADWTASGSQPDTTVSFMYPKRYGTETFAVHAGDGDDSYTIAAWAGAQEPMDLVAHTPVLTLSQVKYTDEFLGNATAGNGNDTFWTAHKNIQSPAPSVWVEGILTSPGSDYTINYATGNVTIINDALSGPVTIDYWAAGSMTLTSGTDYTINQSTSGSDIRYTGFTVVNDNLEGTVIIDYYYAKHWETVQHAAYDQYGTALPPAQTQVPLTSPVGHTYACFADVTELLTGNGAYTSCTGDGQYAVGNVLATQPLSDTSDYATRCFSGWSLVVLFESPTGTAHQFYLWDPIHNPDECPFMVQPVTDFSPQPQYINVPFTLNNFYPPEGTVDGKVTYFVGEGDSVYTGDSIGFKGASQGSYTYLSGTNNPVDDVMNCVSTTGEKGVDIDTYDIWQQVGSDTSANVNLRTQGDRWYLIYMILSFKTNIVPKADYAFNVASVTYQYELGAQ